MDHFELDKEQLLGGFRKYAEVVRITKEVIQRSAYNNKTQLVSAGLVSAWGPWFERSGATALTVGLMNRLYVDLGIVSLFDARAIHMYPQLAKGETSDPLAEQRIAEDVRRNAERCSPDGQPCLVTEWGFQADFDACVQPDPRVNLFDGFLKAVL